MSVIAAGLRLSLVAVLVVFLLSTTVIIPIGTISAQGINPARNLPDAPVQRGETFDVTITFIAPDNDFNAIGLADNVPTNWAIQVDRTWCTPNADMANTVGNQPQYVWFGPYNAGESFTILYSVTVPNGANLGTYTFEGQLGYNIGSGTRLIQDISGDSSATLLVTDPFPITPIPNTGDYCSPDCLCYSYTYKSEITCSRAGAICNDGTCSLSTGSGTCSWHGGVRTWINCP